MSPTAANRSLGVLGRNAKGKAGGVSGLARTVLDSLSTWC